MQGDRDASAEVAATQRKAFPVILFFASLTTTTWAGAARLHPELSWEAISYALRTGSGITPAGVGGFTRLLCDGLSYSFTLMTILLTHEFGHYLAARHHSIQATWPLFLPLPLGLIGTLGAVIGMPERIRRRDHLFDIGAAGPIAGLVVALPLLTYGLYLSPVRPTVPGSLVEGNSLLYYGLKFLIKGQWLPGNGLDVELHAVAWAAWVGLLVTMINLIPVGQLDGGHIGVAWFGDAYEIWAGRVHRLLPLIALIIGIYAFFRAQGVFSDGLFHGRDSNMSAFFAGLPWLVWWLLLKIMHRSAGGRYHPHVGGASLTRGRQVISIVLAIVFLLIIVPIPLSAVPLSGYTLPYSK